VISAIQFGVCPIVVAQGSFSRIANADHIIDGVE
jgi:hypothetical protein